MKLRVLIFALIHLAGYGAYAQVLEPVITLADNPVTYSMHLCTDGSYYYTINGGVAKDGKISKFRVNGEFLESYPINQDMRSIMYSRKDKCLYINCKGTDVYKIADLASGTIQLLHSGMYENEQSTLALDPAGKNFYEMVNGSLTVYNAKTGKMVKKLSGFKCGAKGMKGSTTVAVDNKHIYTWDSDTKTVFVYDMKGVFVQSFVLKSGNIGHSLSAAYGMIFVAKSEMGKPSTWFGYQLPVK
jgi:DNA-binding beta-propeller fold protein YncE